jgi:hypothetical protein
VIYYNVTVNIPMCYSNPIIVNMYWHYRKLVYKIIINGGGYKITYFVTGYWIYFSSQLQNKLFYIWRLHETFTKTILNTTFLMFNEPQSNCIVIKLHMELTVRFRAQVGQLLLHFGYAGLDPLSTDLLSPPPSGGLVMVLGSKYSLANAVFCYLYKMLGVRAPWQLGDGYKNHIPIYSSSNYNSLKSQSPLDQVVLGKWAEKWNLLVLSIWHIR